MPAKNEDVATKTRPTVSLPTVRTISAAAGVSPSTVSRALKGDLRISKATRDRVAAIAAEQGYTPNAIARGLVTRSSGVVGIVLGNMNNPFYGELVECLHRKLVAVGKAPMILHIGGRTLDYETIQQFMQYQIDGCIIASAPLSSTAAEVCARRQLPMVMINRVARTHSCAVSCNNLAGGRLAGDLLIEGGHKKIAFVAGREDTSTSEDREAGLRKALEAAGLDLAGWCRGHYTYDGGFAAGTELLDQRKRPDAIFAANDIMALGVIDAAKQLGLGIPGDLSIMGFDDIKAARWQGYRLTTIAQPMEAMVSRSIELLMERMEDPGGAGEDIYVHGELRIRDTVRLPEGMAASSED